MLGLTVLDWAPRRAAYRPRQWAPQRESWYFLQHGRWLLCLNWRKRGGYYVTSERFVSDPSNALTTYPRREEVTRVKRRDKVGVVGSPVPAASATSVILSKLPLLREWLSATSYDDGGVRTPGALRLTTRGTLWALTLTDPDAGARLPVLGQDLDKTLLLLEQLLGAAEAPWEVDPYAPSRTVSKKKN